MSPSFREIMTQVAEILKSADIPNYYAEARALASVVLNKPVNQIHPVMNITLSDDQERKFLDLAERRKNGEPLQLITGCVGFLNNILMCEPDVFIPRIETEILVKAALDYLSEFPIDQTARILELGVGTGAVLISLACEESRHHYYGIDKSEKAIELARKNARSNNISDKTSFFRGDYFDVVRNWDKSQFNLIISNPPYVKTDEIESLAADVKNWDPLSALDGGVDGLDHYRLIAGDLAKHITLDGVALFEIDPDYVQPLTEVFVSAGFNVSGVYKDYDGNDRVMKITVNSM